MDPGAGQGEGAGPDYYSVLGCPASATEDQLQLSRLSGPVSPVVNFSKLGASFSSPGLAPAPSSDEEAGDPAAQCPQDNCAKIFSKKSSLNRHLLDHKGNQ